MATKHTTSAKARKTGTATVAKAKVVAKASAAKKPVAKAKVVAKASAPKKPAAKAKVVAKASVAKKPVAKAKVVARASAPKKPAAKAKVVAKASAPKKPVAKAKVVAKVSVAKKPVTKAKVVAKVSVAKKPVVKAKVVAKVSVAKKPIAVMKAKSVVKPNTPKPAVVTKAQTSIKSNNKQSSRNPMIYSSTMDKQSHKSMTSTTGLVEFKPYTLKNGEHYMNEKQKQHFREILEKMKHQLMEDVDQTMEMMRDEEKNFSDVADIATHEEVSNLILRTRNREGKLLRKIEESLELIDRDEFGYCEVCGVEIGIRRLEARPTATQCIDCKTLDEIREKQRGN